MAGVALAPAHDTVAPADALLPGCGGKRTEREPAAQSRVGGHFGCSPQHARVTDQQPVPKSFTIAFDAAAIVEPALTLHEEFDGSRRFLQLKPCVGAQRLDAQAQVGRQRLPAQRLEHVPGALGVAVIEKQCGPG